MPSMGDKDSDLSMDGATQQHQQEKQFEEQVIQENNNTAGEVEINNDAQL